jgi:hypothetical protein
MNFLRRLFGGSETAASDGAIHLYVRCNRCGDEDDATGYRLIKEIMDSRCFRLIRAEIEYDRGRHELHRQIEGGTFITKDEYDQLVAQGEQERTT